MWAVRISSSASRRREDRRQPLAHRADGPDGRHPRPLLDVRPLRGVPAALHAVHRRRELAGPAPDHVQELLLERGEQPPGLGVRVGRDHVDPDHRPRLGEPLGRLEVFAVQLQRGQQEVRREVRGERERQAQLGGEARAEVARPQQPDRHVQPLARHGADRLAGLGLAEVGHQFEQVAGEGVAAAAQVAPQGAGGVLVAAGGAAQPEVDPAGVERLQRAELLGDDQRRRGWAA